MKRFYFYFCLIMSFILVGCADKIDSDNVALDNAEFNKNIINYLQNKYGIIAEVSFSSTFNNRLSKNEIEALEKYYKNLHKLTKADAHIKLTKATCQTRTVLGKYGVSYNGDAITVHVYYNTEYVNGEYVLGNNPNVEVGIGGEGNHEYNVMYEVVYQGAEFVYGERYVKVSKVKGDYILRSYPMNYFGNPNTSLPPTMTVKSKIYAEGEVNVPREVGTFSVHYAGEGSWYKLENGL